MSEQQAQPVFSIEKLYVKDVSLEVPNAPQVYAQNVQPEVEMNIHTEASRFDEGLFEVVLTVTVKATASERTVFLVEAAQGGLFAVRNVPEQELEPILSIACPNLLFPFVREVIANMVTRGGFPPVVLAPINFEHLYMQRVAERRGESQDAPATIQ